MFHTSTLKMLYTTMLTVFYSKLQATHIFKLTIPGGSLSVQ